MEPVPQQAQAELLQEQPTASVRGSAGAQLSQPHRAGCCRWALASVSAILLSGFSVPMLFTGPEPVLELIIPEDPDIDLSPLEILRRQLWDNQPRPQRFTLHVSLARLLLGNGRLTEAETQFTEALSLAQSQEERVEARQMLGVTRMRQGRLTAAREFLEIALEFVSPDTDVEVLHALADVRAEMGHFDPAIRLYSRAFNLAESRRDADRAALLAADIGEAWAGKGKLQESIDWLGTAATIIDFGRMSPAGADEIVAAKVDSRLGSVRHRLGNVSAAMDFYRSALRVQAKLLHPNHPDLVSTWLGIAHAQRDLGEAQAAFRDIEAVEKMLRGGMQEGLDLSRVLIVKADILREASRFEDAEQAIQEAIGLQAELFHGEDHPEAAVAMSSYGSILHDSEKVSEAHAKYSEALSISLRTLGEKHPGTAAVHNSLGTLYEDLGDDSTARSHFSKCLEIQLDILGKDSPLVANTYNNLATVLFRQGRKPEAVELLERALQVLDHAGVPSGNPDRALYQENLGFILSRPDLMRSAGSALYGPEHVSIEGR